MIEWLPYAARTATFPGSGGHLEGQWKVVIHSTEGSTMASALATYRQSGLYPHVTIDGAQIEQNCNFVAGATALQNAAGGAQTNRARAIQIEIVGFAQNIGALPQATLDSLRKVLTTLRAEFGISATLPVFKAYPASWGPNNGVRFTPAQWTAFTGICGHQHVPENDHGDPGAMNVAALLTPITQPTPPTVGDTIMKGTPVEMMLAPYHVDMHLDENGNGWTIVSVPVEKVISMVKYGPAPARDHGYEDPGWPDFQLKLNNTDGQALISVESDVPRGHVTFTVWVAE